MTILRWLLTLLLAFLGIHSLGLAPIRCTKLLAPESIHAEQGRAFISGIDLQAQPHFGLAPELILFENGQALGPSDAPHDDIRRIGLGRFSHWNKDLYFASSDNSDPTSNGRHYSFTYVWQPSIAYVAGLILVWLLVFRHSLPKLFSKLETLHPAWITSALILTTLMHRLWMWHNNPLLNFDGHMVLGMPFSDGRGWDTLASDFARGQRTDITWSLWDARRPFYYYFMGSLYAVLGVHLDVARWTKILLSALSSGLIFDGTRRILPVPLAIIAALAHILSSYDALEVITTQSEGLGYFFGNLSWWGFTVGACALLSPQAIIGYRPLWYFAISGVALALSNLTRTLNLSAIFLLPLLLVLLATKNGRLAKNWRQFGLALVVFTASTALTVSPWLVRQKLKYNLLTISDNSSEMLFAASSPEHVTWSSAVSARFKGSSLREKYDFFQSGFKEHLRENWRFYVSNVWHHFKLVSSELIVPAFAMLLAIALGLGQVWNSVYKTLPRLALTGCALAWCVLIVNILGTQSYWLWCVASGLAIITRNSVTLLVGAFLPSLLTLALCAFSGTRATYTLHWSTVTLASWLIWWSLISCVGFWCSTPGPAEENYRSGIATWGNKSARLLSYFFGSVVVVIMCGTAIAIYRHWQPQVALVSYTPAQQLLWLDTTRRLPGCQELSKLQSELKVHLGHPRPDYKVTLAGDQVVNHWSKIFTPRPYAFTIFETLPPTSEVYNITAGDGAFFDKDQLYVLVGVRRTYIWESSFETIAALALNASGEIERTLGCSPQMLQDSAKYASISTGITP